MDSRGYRTYKEQSINTMTRGEMLLLLYAEMLKRLMRAQLALEKKDFILFDQSVVRTRDIVLYLEKTLNYQYPISHELKRMYDYFLYELARLSAGRNPQIITNLEGLIRDLQDAYTQADHQTSL
ncbi:MAG: flagellar export chaperone FliS [Hungatella sp.]